MYLSEQRDFNSYVRCTPQKHNASDKDAIPFSSGWVHPIGGALAPQTATLATCHRSLLMAQSLVITDLDAYQLVWKLLQHAAGHPRR